MQTLAQLFDRGKSIIPPLLGSMAGALFLIAALVLPFAVREQRSELHPRQRHLLAFQAYSDAFEEGGNTRAALSYAGDTITLRYTLGGNCPYPFAALNLLPLDMVTPINGAGSTALEFVLAAPDTCDIQVQILCFAEGFSRINEPLSYATLVAKIVPRPGMLRYRLPLSSFSVPAWWLAANHLTPKSAPQANLAKLEMVALQSAPGAELGREVSIRFLSLATIKAPPHWLRFGIPALLFFMGVSLLRLAQRRKAPAGISPQYRRNSPRAYTPEEAKLLVDHIGEAYADQFLSKQKVIVETKLSVEKVDAILAGEFAMGYRQYLNLIRIVESKRLLKEGNRPIASIAGAVGFFYPNSFTRAFRNVCGMSPSEYRLRGKKE